MAASAPSKKHSKLDKQEVTQGLNQLYTPPTFAKNPGSCIDLIAVPGLGSDMTRTWMSQNVHWLKDDNMLQKVIPEARISVYGYRSQWYGPDAVQEARISSIADDLLHFIHLDRLGKNSKRPIIFVGHSLGGLVVAKAVSEAKRRPEDYPGIFGCITSCVFLGTPFRGSDAQQFAHLVGMAGDVMGLAKYTDLVKSLKAGSAELDDLANDFLGDSRKASIDLVCYYETENTMAKPEWDIGKLFKTGIVIASKKSSTFEGYPNFPWARTHTQMNKFDGPKDVQYKDIAGTLKEMSQKSFKLVKTRQDSSRQDYLNDSRVDRIMESLEVINAKKDLDMIRSVQGSSPSWIQDHPEYISWKESQTHQNLWISGNPGMGKTKIAISTVDDLNSLASLDRTRDDSPAFAYFFCDEQDRDRSKAINVLKTLVWQLLKAKRFLARYFLTDENRSKNATQKSGGQSANTFEFHTLAELWKCLKSALVDPSLGTVYFLVSSLDQIDSDSRKEFLNLITSWQPPDLQDEDGSAPVVKWLFLSVPRLDIQETLQEAVRINLDDGSNSANQNDALRKLVAEEVGKIAKKKGYSLSLEYFAKSYISFRAEGKSNLDWVNLVCLELEYDGVNYSTIRQHLESLPSDLGPMYDQLSRRVLSAPSPNVECSKEILRCLLLVHTPPTLYELGVIAGLPEEDRNVEEAIINHVHHCGAFTQIFDDDGKLRVQLSYNSVRDYLKSKSNDWLSMPSEQIQHGIISLRCFEYVLAAVRKATAINRAQHDAETKNEEEGSKNEAEGEEDEQNEMEAVDEEEINTENQVKEEDDRERSQIEQQENEKNNKDEEEEGSEMNDEHVVLEPVATDDETQEPDLMPLDYPYTEWIEHALEATPDIVESFGLEDVFWVLDSEERAEWSRSYSSLNDEEEFDLKFTALHIAAYFGYVPLADLLLRNQAHRAELAYPDSNGHRPLYWACKRGRMNMVQKLCDEGADINGGNADNKTTATTPLHGAASSGVVEIAEYLLNKGATIDVPSKDDGTALYVAAEEEFSAIVQLLLDRGADPNIVGGSELTPLNAAALSGNLEIVQLLISNGAELNPEIEYRYGNAVAVAAFYGNIEVVKFLLEKGCRFDIGDLDNEYPLSLAAREDYPDIVRVILKYDKRPESHDQALASAAETNRVECARVLIERCSVLQKTEPFRIAARNGFTEILNVLTNSSISIDDLNGALYEATDYQHIDTVALLLEMSADPNAEGEEYGNALQAAAFDGSDEILKMLLDKNADPNRVYGEDTFGTALQAAAFQGSLNNVKLLVEHGALINVPMCGKYGNPLQAACCANADDVVEFLLSKGADVNAFGGPQYFPILAATKFGYGTIVEHLLNYDADVNIRDAQKSTPLINAASELQRSYIELLCEHGADIHAFDEDGDTAFIMAADCGDVDSVAYLLEKGSDIQRIGKWGGALYRTTLTGSLDCMKLLLERGIDVDQRGGAMCTALQVAASYGNIEEVKLLLEHNASVNIQGGRYQTALQAAVGTGDEELVQWILDHGATVNDQGGRYGSPLHAAVRISNSTLVDLLLKHDANVNAVDETTGSVLALAARRASTEIVTTLLEKGADVNLRGGKYDTAIQVACYMGTLEEAKMFLEHGADPTVDGGFYGSALSAAASKGNVELIQLLLGHEKRPSSEMISAALFTAVHYRQPEAVNLLLETGADVMAENETYASVMEALETEMSPAELDQANWTGDDFPKEAEDADDETEDAAEDEDQDSDGDGEGDDDDDSAVLESEEDEADADKAEAIEIYEGIKAMLIKALEALKPPEQESTSPVGEFIPTINSKEVLAQPGLEVVSSQIPTRKQSEGGSTTHSSQNTGFSEQSFQLRPLSFEVSPSEYSIQAAQESSPSQPSFSITPQTPSFYLDMSQQALTQPALSQETFESPRRTSIQTPPPYPTSPAITPQSARQRPISTQTQSAPTVPYQLQPGPPQTPRKPIPRKPAPVLPPTLQAGNSCFQAPLHISASPSPPIQEQSTETTEGPAQALYPFNPDAYGRQGPQGPGANQLGYSSVSGPQSSNGVGVPEYQEPVYGGGKVDPMQNQNSMQQQRPPPPRKSSSDLSTAGLKNKWKRFLS